MPDLLRKELLAEIYTIRKANLDSISEIVKDILTSLSDSENSNPAASAIRKGIREIQDKLISSGGRELQDHIITSIFIIKESLPQQVRINQAVEGFESAVDDGVHVKVGKTIKRLIQGMGKDEWSQEIPLQNLVAYHLLDADDWYKKWIGAEAQLLMNLILELEQTLVNSISGKTLHISESELRQLLRVFLNQIEEAQSVLDQKLDEARMALDAQLQTAIARVGTFGRRPGFYSPQRISQKRENTIRELNDHAEDWLSINTQLLAKAGLMLQLIEFCSDMYEVVTDCRKKLEGRYDELFIKPKTKLEKKIAAVRQQIINGGLQLSVLLGQQEQKLSVYINKQIEEPIKHSLDNNEFDRILKLLAKQLSQCANDLPETAAFITDIDRENDPPVIKLQEVQWRMLVIRIFKDNVLAPIRSDEERVEDFTREQLREIQEVRDIIYVNLESASDLAEDQTEQDNPLEVVDEALNRAQSKINDSIERVGDSKEILTARLEEGLKQFKISLFELLHYSDPQKLKVLNAKYKINEKNHGSRAKTSARWAWLQDWGAVMARFGWKKVKKYYDKSSTFLGLRQPETTEAKKADIATYLTEIEQQFKELPFIYRRLFDFNTMTEERYYVGLNENFGQIREALDHWQNGLSATMAVVGEKGSGKSTYLDLVNSKVLTNEKVLRISLNDTVWTAENLLAIFEEQFPEADCSSIDALVRFLNEHREPPIIIFEGIQNLYIRQINGYEAIEQFVYLIAETADDIFWLISCSRYAWSFLSKAVKINEFFSYLIETDTLNKPQMEKAIMSRHRASGYELVFASSESDAKSRSYKKLLDDQEKAQDLLKEKYFDKLAKLSDGNTSIAMIFWLRSIQKFDDTHCYIAPLEVAPLEDLNFRILFILASLVLHDTLDAEQLSAIQTMSVQESRVVLKRLKSRSIIDDSGHGYFLNHLMYRQVVDELKERNILHL